VRTFTVVMTSSLGIEDDTVQARSLDLEDHVYFRIILASPARSWTSSLPQSGDL
jgi:hypothetical protein